MTFNVETAQGLVSVFAGVNQGYQGSNVAITNPETAVDIASKELRTMNVAADIYPGRVVYPLAAGCPADGEVIAAIFLKPDAHVPAEMFEALKSRLQQTSLSVISPQSAPLSLPAMTTEGFIARLSDNDLEGLAAAWQDHASKQKISGGLYVSGALYQADGVIYAQAEANPNRASSGYVSDIAMWRDEVKDLVSHLDEMAEPVFRPVNFSYLRTVSPA